MADQLSRYQAVQHVTAADPRGRVLPGTDVRALPEVTGSLRHRVQQGDRLDQLAQTYYGQPLQWWHICDANPDVLSPLALVGAEPVTDTDFPVVAPAEPPPWTTLLRALSALAGVHAVSVVDGAIRVLHNTVVTPAAGIVAVISEGPFRPAGPPVEHGRVGQLIVVPPPVAG